ncbi:MAG TPA: hypothetical protein VJ792_01550 [Candidatus Nitrosotalea sp.]|nr:hypothetical protein [Candidatus Nitrosotalea sp.]
MSPKNAEETISEIDSIIRVLSKAAPHGSLVSQDDIKALQGVDSEDQLKLADGLEDMIVLLKDEPDNKRKILEAHDLVKDQYGHVKPVREVLDGVKAFFLSK